MPNIPSLRNSAQRRKLTYLPFSRYCCPENGHSKITMSKNVRESLLTLQNMTNASSTNLLRSSCLLKVNSRFLNKIVETMLSSWNTRNFEEKNDYKFSYKILTSTMICLNSGSCMWCKIDSTRRAKVSSDRVMLDNVGCWGNSRPLTLMPPGQRNKTSQTWW